MFAEFNRGFKRLAARWNVGGHPRDPAIAAMLGLGNENAAGQDVTEDSALTLSAVWCATSLISSSFSCLPPIVYRTEGDDERVKRRDRKSPLWKLLHESPNKYQTAPVFYGAMQMQVLLCGNALAEIQVNGRGDPIALWPIHPARVRIWADKAGDLRYTRIEGNADISPDRIIHVIGMTRDGFRGESVVGFARESFGVGLASDRFGGAFFGNSARPSGAIKHPLGLTEEAANRVLEKFNSQLRGASNHGKTVLLEEGAEYQPIGVAPEDAQFLETRQFTITEVARWFNIPPHKLKDLSRATFSNIEHQSIEYMTDTMLPWVRRWEAELNRKLVTEPNQFVQFNMDSLLRADITTRYGAYRIGLQEGFLSPNDVLEKEDSNPIPNGDVYMRPANQLPTNSRAESATSAPAVVSSMEPITSRILRRMRTRESEAYSKHRGSATFATWEDRWLREHVAILRQEFTSIADAIRELSGIEVRGSIESLIDEHCDELRRCGGDLAEEPAAEASRWSSRICEVSLCV